MTLEPGRVYRIDEIAEEESPYKVNGRHCHHPSREAAEGLLFGRPYLVERCTDCPREWPIRPLTAQRRDQIRRAQARVRS